MWITRVCPGRDSVTGWGWELEFLSGFHTDGLVGLGVCVWVFEMAVGPRGRRAEWRSVWWPSAVRESSAVLILWVQPEPAEGPSGREPEPRDGRGEAEPGSGLPGRAGALPRPGPGRQGAGLGVAGGAAEIGGWSGLNLSLLLHIVTPDTELRTGSVQRQGRAEATARLGADVPPDTEIDSETVLNHFPTRGSGTDSRTVSWPCVEEYKHTEPAAGLV